MKINFIRHGKTLGNLEHRYIGSTDEALCDVGIMRLRESIEKYPSCDMVICSPLKRCIQTSEIIYPDKKPLVIYDLRECNFGDFEGKNYIELNGDERYQAWIDSGGSIPFPNGEAHEHFINRCSAAFYEAVKCVEENMEITFVIHGGSIMAILEGFALPKKNFYDYQVKNGCGFCTEFDGKNIAVISEF